VVAENIYKNCPSRILEAKYTSAITGIAIWIEPDALYVDVNVGLG
jgi:hypothetical protein